MIVPTSMPLPAVLTQLTKARQEMALVIDEYGGLAGVLTIEDMAEELVGEIADEHDPDIGGGDTIRVGDGWLIQGDTHLDEVARTLGRELPQGDYETIAGLVIAAFGGLPAVGDSVEIPLDPDPAELAHGEPAGQTLLVEVRAVDRYVPASVLVTVRAGGSAAGGGTES